MSIIGQIPPEIWGVIKEFCELKDDLLLQRMDELNLDEENKVLEICTTKRFKKISKILKKGDIIRYRCSKYNGGGVSMNHIVKKVGRKWVHYGFGEKILMNRIIAINGKIV